MATTEAKIPRISKIWAKNFRSIENLELELGPLTVLVGPNASGKSNIVDVFRFVSDVLRDGLDSALISRRGDHAARRSSPRRRSTDVTVGLAFDDESTSVLYEFVVRLNSNGLHKVILEKATGASTLINSDPINVEIKNGRLTKPRLMRPKGTSKESTEEAYIKALVAYETREGSDLAFPFTNIGMALDMRNIGKSELVADSYRGNRLTLDWSAQNLRRMRFYHIFPDALREPQLMSSKYPLEEHGENLASVLDDMKRKQSPYFPELLSTLAQVVPGLEDISVTRAGGHLVIRLLHHNRDAPGKGIWLDASQESDGTLRTLGLLVALYQDPTPSFIAIEEPELTIHPGALSVLAEVILEASRRTPVLVTTHSPELLDNLPIDCIRSVDAQSGSTRVGPVAEHQKAAVMKGLFSPGELHRMEGLQPAVSDES